MSPSLGELRTMVCNGERKTRKKMGQLTGEEGKVIMKKVEFIRINFEPIILVLRQVDEHDYSLSGGELVNWKAASFGIVDV